MSSQDYCYDDYKLKKDRALNLFQKKVFSETNLTEFHSSNVNNIFKCDGPFKEDGEINFESLTLTQDTSSDLTLLSPVDKQIADEYIFKKKKFNECNKRFGGRCACSLGLLPKRGEQLRYGLGKRRVTLVSFTDRRDSSRRIWKLVKIQSWDDTIECACQDDDDGDDEVFAAFKAEDFLSPNLVRQLELQTEKVIRKIRRNWLVNLFKKCNNDVERGSKKIFLCKHCSMTSVYGKRDNIIKHIKTLMNTSSVNSGDYLASLYQYLHDDHGQVPEEYVKAIAIFLKIPMFECAYKFIRAQLRRRALIDQASSSSVLDTESSDIEV